MTLSGEMVTTNARGSTSPTTTFTERSPYPVDGRAGPMLRLRCGPDHGNWKSPRGDYCPGPLGHLIMQPASIGMLVPVMYLDWSDARNSTSSATSSGSIHGVAGRAW